MKKKVRVLLLLCMLALSLGGTAVAGHAAEDDTTMTGLYGRKRPDGSKKESGISITAKTVKR